MNIQFRYGLFLKLIFFQPVMSFSQGIYLNEFSNGSAGAQEYFEFVVDAAGSCDLDLRGWLFDDNNGDFGTGSTAGIASGHFRFSPSGPWSNIPTGSIILIYNDGDKNASVTLADDPYDSNGDKVYVIPSSNTDLEYCTSLPGSADPTYTPCTYSSGTNWTALSLRNAGDAVQVRYANGNYFHGASFGDANITGGPDNLKISSSTGTGKVYYFNGGDYRLVSNWSFGTAGTPAETPGFANNATNQTFISSFNCLTLPVELLHLNANQEGKLIQLKWATATETNNDYFEIQRSLDGINYSPIGKQSGEGNSTFPTHYKFTDKEPGPGINYYRLKQFDFNGEYSLSTIVAVKYDKVSSKDWKVFPNPVDDIVNIELYSPFNRNAVITITDVTGSIIFLKEVLLKKELNKISFFPALKPGIYSVSINLEGHSFFRTKITVR